MTRHKPRTRPTLEQLTTLQIAALTLCRFSLGGICACYDTTNRAPACQPVRETAAKIVADVRLYDGRAQEGRT